MNRSTKLALILTVTWTYAETYPSVHAQTLDYAFIADTNTPIPGGTGNFTLMPRPGISNGDVIFNGEGTGGQEGLYFFRGGVLDVLVNQDTSIPNGTGTFNEFDVPTFDPLFNVAFRAKGDSGQIGIYTHMDGTLGALANLTTDVPGTGGAEQFTDFSTPWIYNGEVAFRGVGSGGTEGIYTNKGGSLRVVADTSTIIPNGTGTFTDFGFSALGQPLTAPDIEGDIAFLGNGSSGQEGIYAEINGTLTRIADKNTLIPGSASTFPRFDGNIALAANIHDGEIVFVAGGSSSSNQLGLYKYSSGTITTIADRNTVNPDTGGTLTFFGGAQGYGFDNGDVNFLGQDSLGGPLNKVFAILGGQLTTVAAPGDIIEGRTVLNSLGTYGEGIENGSVAFNTGTANFVAIQEHRWLGTGSAIYRGTGSGDLWEDSANWPYGLLPRNTVPTVIDPAGDVTIHGPHSDVTLSSLQIGGGNGIATLWLNEGAEITVNLANVTATGALAGNGTFSRDILNNGLIRPDNISAFNIQNNAIIDLASTDARLEATNDVTNDGTISGDGTFQMATLINNGLVDVRQLTISNACIENFGEIRLSRVGALIEAADEFHNMGLIRGSGSIDSAVFDNNASGEIRIGSGGRLEFQVDVSNAGRIEVLEGELETHAGTFNSGSALITGRDATFRFGTGLTNNAAFAISFGTSDVFGDVTNNVSGTIVATGNSNITFYDDVTNNGTFQVSSGSTAVFLGDFNGANGISGAGAVFMEGDLRPGNSPAAVSFGGDLILGALSNLEIELGGVLSGEFDQLIVNGGVNLNGTLDVSIIDGFVPDFGDVFKIVDTGSLSGQFSGLDEGAMLIADGVELVISYLSGGASDVELTVAGFTASADFDLDSDVDASDLAIWETNFGSTGISHAQGDTDGDAAASGFDFLAWQRQFSSGGGVPLAAAAAIPEPSSLLLAALGLLTVCTRRKRA